MVTFGTQLARRAAALTGSRVVRDLLLTEQTAIAAFMIIGIICIGASFWFFNRYKLLALGLFVYAQATASAGWQPIHDTSFALKYLMMVYFAT